MSSVGRGRVQTPSRANAIGQLGFPHLKRSCSPITGLPRFHTARSLAGHAARDGRYPLSRPKRLFECTAGRGRAATAPTVGTAPCSCYCGKNGKARDFMPKWSLYRGLSFNVGFACRPGGERRDESLSHGLDHFFKPRVGWPHCLTDARSGSNSNRQDLRPKRFLYSRDRHLPGRKPDCRKSVQYHARLFPRRGRCGHVDGARDSFYSGSSRSRDRLSLGNVRRKGRVRVECRHAPSREPDTIRRTGCRP